MTIYAKVYAKEKFKLTAVQVRFPIHYRDISTGQQELKKPIIPMTLTEIERPQISGGCPYKVLNSQWVPTRPEAMMKNDQK